MIAYVDSWLDIWAEWSRSKSVDLGFSSRSPIYAMMTTNRAEVTAQRHRSKLNLIKIGDRYFPRGIEPMRSVETRSRRVEMIPECLRGEMMEAAVIHLHAGYYRDAIKLKYRSEFNNKTSAQLLRLNGKPVSVSMFKCLINESHMSIDSYLRIRFADEVQEFTREMELIKSLSG